MSGWTVFERRGGASVHSPLGQGCRGTAVPILLIAPLAACPGPSAAFINASPSVNRQEIAKRISVTGAE